MDGYLVTGHEKKAIYQRQGDRFVKTSQDPENLSPDGRWRVTWSAAEETPLRKVVLVDRTSGRRLTVRLPVDSGAPKWSPNGKFLLFTAYRPVREDDDVVTHTRIGFVLYDVANRRSRLVKVNPVQPVSQIDLYGAFGWNADGSGVLANLDPGRGDDPIVYSLALYDLKGIRQRVYPDVGELPATAPAPFSPSGAMFVTRTQKPFGLEDSLRVVRAETGAVVLRMNLGLFTEFYGWYDEKHLILSYRNKKMITTFEVVSLSGKRGTTLIREQIVAGPASYEPHITRLHLKRRDR
ncbi:hypothetical protein [Rhizohabitans arisaemae]|uniref:hypothetical protein n=1 Tax=Rhizohabitans arisaemae TaxID=2720610 RepID=UPI0024B1D9C2|nr:hypothetical protein [Rhizohabitans arisaemae]